MHTALKLISAIALAHVAGAATAATAAKPDPATPVAAGDSRHGALEFPIARQYHCNKTGGYYWPIDGSGISDPGCRAAYQAAFAKDRPAAPDLAQHEAAIKAYREQLGAHAGDSSVTDEQANKAAHAVYPLEQWPEFSVNVPQYNEEAKVKEQIPDGHLCSAGQHGQNWDPRKGLWNDKSGFDIPANWTAQEVTPNADGKVHFKFHIMAVHNPSFWRIYLSKPGYDASQRALKWDDLELLESLGNIEPTGNFYEMDVDFKNHTGKRVVYIRWQREDAVGEGFYNCSDVNIVARKAS